MDTFFSIYDRWNGLIPLIGGIYATLMAAGYLPRNPKDPERMALWRKKFGPMMMVLGPILAVIGLIQIVIHL